MTQPEGELTREACLSGCQSDATCLNLEYTDLTKECKYFTGKCSQRIDFDLTIEIFVKEVCSKCRWVEPYKATDSSCIDTKQWTQPDGTTTCDQLVSNNVCLDGALQDNTK